MWLGTAVAIILVVTRLREPAVDDDPPPMQAKNWLFIAAMSAYLAATYAAISPSASKSPARWALRS